MACKREDRFRHNTIAFWLSDEEKAEVEAKIILSGVPKGEYYRKAVLDDDRHPSMKVDKNYHCFACGVGGDVIDYTARMYGLSQYDAAKKLIEDFGLHVQTEAMSREERQRLRREKEERMRIIQIKKRFYRWCEETIELLKDALVQIEDSGQVLYGKPPDVIFSEDYAMMLHAEPIINYWLDILCMGSEQEKKELFMQGRKEVEQVAGNVRKWSRCIMARCRESA